MKCRYAHCKYGGEVEKEEAIKIGSAYYHKECNQEREYKKKIESTYYDKYKTKEPIIQVRKAINKYINIDNYEVEYILFVLKQDIKLNSMFGLIYYLNNKKFLDMYNKELAKLIKFDASEVDTEESINVKFKRKKQKGWGDMICK